MGFEFHEPNTKDWGPRLGATYRLSEKTVLRAGWGIYYNPNQMNSFTFLTNNPPIAAEFTFSNNPTNPTLSFDQPFGVVGPGGPPNMITPNRHLPNARKNQWSADLQHEVGASTVVELQYLASRTRTSIGASSTTRRCQARAVSTPAGRTRRSARSARSPTTSSPTTTR